MRHQLALAVALCIVILSGAAWTRAQQVKPVSVSPTTIDDVLTAVRSDLQSSRADIIAKNVSLTSAQAAKFWPLFESYQKEQSAIMDEQMKGVQKYVDSYQTLDDDGALALMTAHMTRDGNMNALRQKYLAEFQKVLPAKLAVRVIQIDRRLSLLAQALIKRHRASAFGLLSDFGLRASDY